MKVQVLDRSYETAMPPSLPVRMCSVLAGLIQMACTSSCVTRAASVSMVLPPSIVICMPTPPM